MRLDETFILSSVPHSRIIQGSVPTSVQFSIDSRSTKKGDMFIPLAGERTDGHSFLENVIEKGCAGFFINENKLDLLSTFNKSQLQNLCIIVVQDTLKALNDLARAWRSLFTEPVIALTGSVGKTTTKNIIAQIMKAAGKNYCMSPGNQNTLIGVPLNILRFNAEHDGAICEVGINQRGEMARMIDILRPTTAIITGIGHSHMAGLGALADISSEKRDIFKCFHEKNLGFINGDQPILSQVSYSHPVVKFGLKTTNQIQARKIVIDGLTTKFLLKIYKDKYQVTLPYIHSGAVINTLAAVAVTHHLDIPHDIIIQAISKPVIVPGRFERRPLKQAQGFIINDCYNANPESMKASLLAFEKLQTSASKIAILGDMLELGSDSAFWHRQIGRFLRKVPTLQRLVLVGNLVEWTKKTCPAGLAIEHVKNWQEALEAIKPHLQQDVVMLVKGSRGMQLTNLVNDLTVVPTYDY